MIGENLSEKDKLEIASTSNSIRMEMSRLPNVSFITSCSMHLDFVLQTLLLLLLLPVSGRPGRDTIDGNWTGVVDNNYPPNDCFRHPRVCYSAQWKIFDLPKLRWYKN